MLTKNKKGDELMLRILDWVVEVMKFIDILPRSVAVYSVVRQLADSVGSTGANFVEARAGRSHKEFISSTGIAAKECKESLFWLAVLQQINPGNEDQIKHLAKEGNEIASILTLICKNAKLNDKDRKEKS